MDTQQQPGASLEQESHLQEAEVTEPIQFLDIASYASAESMEILNLLGEQSESGGCCGGSCCSA